MNIEQRTIDFIPENERYGKPKDLFAVWFGANLNLTTIITGTVLVVMGMNLFWSALAILLGSLIGNFFVASHSAQGPKLGIPQMIQSRAQFGVFGAIIPMIFVMFIYMGFGVANTLLVTQTLNEVVPLSENGLIIMFSLLSIIMAIFGYKLIHASQKILSICSFFILGIGTIIALFKPFPEGAWSAGNVDGALFFVSVGIVATYVLALAPYVADYSRYLPSNASSSKVFWFSYVGLTSSTTWMMLVGAILAVVLPGFADHSGGLLAGLFGSYSPMMYILIIYGLLAINVFNFYGAFMAVITTIQPFNKLNVTSTIRVAIFSVILIANIGLSMLGGKGDFINFFINFIYFMGYFLIPWTAINLVDFYLIRRGSYSIADIFDSSGQYGKFNGATIFSFLISILLEIPFISTTLYVGPVAEAMSGVDLAWLVGIIVSSFLYYFLMKAKLAKQIPQITTK